MSFLVRLHNRIGRDLAQWLCRRTVRVQLEKPVISFTFDDFPRSALLTAGPMLRAQGILGTYYTSFGLMGQTAPTGEIFLREDLNEFVKQGHELACHTFDHCHSWNTAPAEFEASILRNQTALAEILPGKLFNNFSYPISHPRPDTKRRTAQHYRSARGGGQTFNHGTTDLNYLKAFFIEQSRDNVNAIKQVIDANTAANGWLIFTTHDVSANPTRFGCTSEVFKQVVEYSAKSGAAILPVNEALERLNRKDKS
jgi:peptidoglycan/xylan/chitin deacetylase (PgdA/CDA1 family)